MGIGLETLFHLVYEIVHWAVAWTIPGVVHVEATDRGVRVTKEHVVELEPGWHFYHRRLQTVYTANVRRQTIALPDQLLTTHDRKRVRVGGLLVYHVTDVTKFLIENDDAAEGLVEMAGHALREVVIDGDFADMQKKREQKRDELTRSAQEMLGQYGVRVEYLRLSTFAETAARDIYHGGSLFTGAVAPMIDDED